MDSSDSFYKKCFETCKNCSEGGNKINNNCLECIDNYTFIKDPLNNLNCYQLCNYYYYFDASNNYHCSENEICPGAFDKLIPEKKKCIDECRKDDTFKYEFNNNCYEKCPNGTFNVNDNYLLYLPK